MEQSQITINPLDNFKLGPDLSLTLLHSNGRSIRKNNDASRTTARNAAAGARAE